MMNNKVLTIVTHDNIARSRFFKQYSTYGVIVFDMWSHCPNPVLSLKMYEHWSYFDRQMSHAKLLSDKILHTTKVVDHCNDRRNGLRPIPNSNYKTFCLKCPPPSVSVYLGSLSPDFTSTSQGSVHLSSSQGDGEVNSLVL